MEGPLTRPLDSLARGVFPSLWPQKVGRREKTDVGFMGGGWTGLRGIEATIGSGTGQKLFVQAPGVDVASSPLCPARPAWGTSVRPSPPFPCERQRDLTRGLGTAICSWEGFVLGATCPRTGVGGRLGRTGEEKKETNRRRLREGGC